MDIALELDGLSLPTLIIEAECLVESTEADIDYLGQRLPLFVVLLRYDQPGWLASPIWRCV
jgi:hypothetical protein